MPPHPLQYQTIGAFKISFFSAFVIFCNIYDIKTQKGEGWSVASATPQSFAILASFKLKPRGIFPRLEFATFCKFENLVSSSKRYQKMTYFVLVV